MRSVIVTVLTLIVIAPLFSEVSVTIYNQDLGLVRESREFDFPKGIGEIRFVDVAAQIIPTSVHFSSKYAALLEQNYEYDLVSSDKLLGKFIDREVELLLEGDEMYSGTLLSSSGDVVLREKDGSIMSLSRDRLMNVHFPDLPEGLITRPTLVWTVQAKKAKTGTAEVSYLTRGIQWESEYVAVTDKDDKSLSLTGWVNITNHSGAEYKDARVKLMAGDVQIIRDRGRKKRPYDLDMMSMSAEGAQGFQEQPFYEYHLYTLQRPATIRQNQIKQISLFPTAEVNTVEKEYRFDYYQWSNKVNVTLIFKNEKVNNLGIPLPKGKVRVYKEGPDGGLEFVGEDLIDHTPKDETVCVSTGKAFDVVGERTELEQTRRGKEREVELKVRNHKDETVVVVVAERLYGDWTILDATVGWKKVDSSLIEWRVSLKPDEEKILTYRVLFNY